MDVRTLSESKRFAHDKAADLVDRFSQMNQSKSYEDACMAADQAFRHLREAGLLGMQCLRVTDRQDNMADGNIPSYDRNDRNIRRALHSELEDIMSEYGSRNVVNHLVRMKNQDDFFTAFVLTELAKLARKEGLQLDVIKSNNDRDWSEWRIFGLSSKEKNDLYQYCKNKNEQCGFFSPPVAHRPLVEAESTDMGTIPKIRQFIESFSGDNLFQMRYRPDGAENDVQAVIIGDSGFDTMIAAHELKAWTRRYQWISQGKKAIRAWANKLIRET